MGLRVLLADDHVLVREGLRILLEAEAGVEIVGQAGDGSEAIALVVELRPDVVVLDLMMPGIDGLEATREVTRRSPETRVVILSMYANEAYVVEALRSGAAAYVLKQAPSSELVRAIEEGAAGRPYLSPPLSGRAIEAYLRWAEGKPPDPLTDLSRREREVLELVAEGLTSAAIAERLFVSRRTIESHRASLLKKLRVRSAAEVVRFAVSRGIVPAEPWIGGDPSGAVRPPPAGSGPGSVLLRTENSAGPRMAEIHRADRQSKRTPT